MCKLTKNEIKQKDAIEIINKMDYNKDGKIEWNEFLQVMYDWLKSLGILNDIGNSSDSSRRKIMHLNMAQFFL